MSVQVHSGPRVSSSSYGFPLPDQIFVIACARSGRGPSKINVLAVGNHAQDSKSSINVTHRMHGS